MNALLWLVMIVGVFGFIAYILDKILGPPR
jgi:nitrate reductase NapE component